MSKAKVAYASISEKGTVNGSVGDQTGKEVKVNDYYDFGQTLYFRFSNSLDAWYMGTITERFAENNLIGYGQNDRALLFNICKENGWQSTKVKEKCNCDCSSMVATAFNCVFEEEILKSDTYTGNLLSRLKATKKGYINKVTKNYKPMCGDIVWKPNKHVVTVCASIK